MPDRIYLCHHRQLSRRNPSRRAGTGFCEINVITRRPVSQPPTRIAFCITDLDPGGAERALVQLVTRLDRAEWEPRVYCLGPSGALVDPLVQADVPVECLGARSARDLRVISRLTRKLRACRPALLQTFLFHANLVGRLAARFARVPVVVCGIRVAEREKHWHLRLDRWTQRLVTHNVCVSRAVAEFSTAQGGLPPAKLSVIPNGVDAERFARAAPADLSPFGIPPGARTILSVGRLDRQKGHDLLLRAVAPLLASDADLHVLIVGDGPLRGELQSQVGGLGCTEQVHLAGWQQGVAEVMKASTLFALPSRWEGMPNVVLEAMAASLPVVAADVEGVREIVQDGVNGLVVRSESVEEIRHGLQRLLDDSALRMRLARESQAIASKEFAIQHVSASYVRLYRELLAGA